MSGDLASKKRLWCGVHKTLFLPAERCRECMVDEIERLQQHVAELKRYATAEQARDAVVDVVRALRGDERTGAVLALNAIAAAMNGTKASPQWCSEDRRDAERWRALMQLDCMTVDYYAGPRTKREKKAYGGHWAIELEPAEIAAVVDEAISRGASVTNAAERCISAKCTKQAMQGSCLCEEHYNALPAAMRGEPDETSDRCPECGEELVDGHHQPDPEPLL